MTVRNTLNDSFYLQCSNSYISRQLLAHVAASSLVVSILGLVRYVQYMLPGVEHYFYIFDYQVMWSAFIVNWIWNLKSGCHRNICQRWKQKYRLIFRIPHSSPSPRRKKSPPHWTDFMTWESIWSERLQPEVLLFTSPAKHSNRSSPSNKWLWTENWLACWRNCSTVSSDYRHYSTWSWWYLSRKLNIKHASKQLEEQVRHVDIMVNFGDTNFSHPRQKIS